MRYLILMAFAILFTFSACKEKTPTTNKDTTVSESTTVIEEKEDGPKSVQGTVYDLNIIKEPTGLWIFMEDAEGKEYELNFYREGNPEKYDALTEDLIEVEIQAFYEIKEDGEKEELVMIDYEMIPENPEN